MDEKKNRKSPRLQGYDYSRNGAYFITVCTKNRQCVLSRIVGTGVPDCPRAHAMPVGTGVPDCPRAHAMPVETGVLDCPQIELTEKGRIADAYIRQLDSFYAHLSVKSYVIMPNHIHMLLLVGKQGQSGTPVPTEYEETVNSNNTNIEKANSVVSQFISTFKRFCNKDFKENIWQERYFDHIIRNRVDYEAHLRYIAENPLHWLYDELSSEQSLQHTGNTKDPTP